MLGPQVLLEAARRYGVARLVHISTDEVYGSAPPDVSFDENAPLCPSSPYAASKASGDLLVASYVHTFGLPAIVLRCTNNYGPYQFPEKLIPLMIANALEDRPLPVYGDGLQARDGGGEVLHTLVVEADLRFALGEDLLHVAQFLLGARDERGPGPDPAGRTAAEQGFAPAQSNLGAAYAQGQGVVADVAQALQWYRKAAAQGDAIAERNLGRMYEQGQGVTTDDAAAAKWYAEAAARGDADAQYRLGVMYAQGRGVIRNNGEAVKWYREAAAQQFAPARQALDELTHSQKPQ